jgi:putative membrane-bound dehydrogenase-like protein
MVALLFLPLLFAQSEQLSKQFNTPFHDNVELYAESPLFFNPTAIDVDKDGNVWVTEAVNYRQWDGKNPGRHHEDGDRVIVLRDLDGDGKAETSIVFAQDKDLVAPLGILVLEDRVLVSCSPNLIEYRDTDGDFVADEKKILLTGFGGFNHDHGLHSLVEDGKGGLLWCAGNAGPHVVTGTDGKTIRSGSAYNGGGPAWAGNVAGLVSDDGVAYTGGIIGRMDMDGSNIEILAHNFRNEYEVAIDKYGNMYTADNDDDGNESCRTVTVVPGGNYGYFSADGKRFWNADRRVAQNIQSAHWHQRDPGVMPHGTITGSGGPTGVTVYEHDAVPEMNGWLLNADAGRSIVFAFKPNIRGSQLTLEQYTLIEANREGDRGTWFRPSDVAVGNNGEIYVADWYDPGVGGHAAGDSEAYGRILKLTPDQTYSKVEEPSEEMLRVAAMRKAEDKSLYINDPSPFVRAICAVEIRTLDPAIRLPLLIALAKNMPANDRNYLESIGIGAKGMEPEFFAALYQLSNFDQNDLLHLAWRLHPKEALDYLAFYVSSNEPYLMRRLAIDGIAFMDEIDAAEEMIRIAMIGPEDTRNYATWWLENRVTNSWSNYGINIGTEAELAEATLAFTSRIFTPKTNTAESVSIEIKDGKTLWLLVGDTGNGNSNDWAVWIDPEFIHEDGTATALTSLEWNDAETKWGQVHNNKTCEGGELHVFGNPVDGIGTHADSFISYAIPESATGFRCKVAADDGGAARPGSATSIQFEVYVESKRDEAFISAQQELAKTGDRDAQNYLLESQEGSLFLLEHVTFDAYLTKKLQAHNDLAVRAFFDNARAQSVPESIFAFTGSIARGQELYRGKGSCFSCHVFDGIGGLLGPDLSTIRDKHNAHSIYTAIYDPQAAIAIGYENWIIELNDGKRFFCSILAEGDVVLVKDSAGKRHAIHREDIASRKPVLRSLMTSAAALQLSEQDVADITAFLLENKEVEFTHEIDLLENGLDDFAFQLPEGTDPADVWRIEDGVLKCSGIPIGYIYTKKLYTDFELEFDWRGNPEFGPGNSGALLRVQEPHKVWPKSIEAQLMSKNAGDIWNIDKFNMVVNEDRTTGRHTKKALPTNEKPLGQWNHYRIRLVGSNLTLEVNGEVQNTASWCERIPGAIALQSEGAVIEFKNIVLRTP